jgi:hypothetical protein
VGVGPLERFPSSLAQTLPAASTDPTRNAPLDSTCSPKNAPSACAHSARRWPVFPTGSTVTPSGRLLRHAAGSCWSVGLAAGCSFGAGASPTLPALRREERHHPDPVDERLVRAAEKGAFRVASDIEAYNFRR